MATNETGLVRAIIRAVREKYPEAFCFNVVGSPYQMTGVPDLLLCVRGLFIAVEVKFPHPGESDQHARERATPGQRVQIGRINTAGGMAGVVISVEEALALIERGLKYRRGGSHGEGDD